MLFQRRKRLRIQLGLLRTHQLRSLLMRVFLGIDWSDQYRESNQTSLCIEQVSPLLEGSRVRVLAASQTLHYQKLKLEKLQ